MSTGEYRCPYCGAPRDRMRDNKTYFLCGTSRKRSGSWGQLIQSSESAECLSRRQKQYERSQRELSLTTTTNTTKKSEVPECCDRPLVRVHEARNDWICTECASMYNTDAKEWWGPPSRDHRYEDPRNMTCAKVDGEGRLKE